MKRPSKSFEIALSAIACAVAAVLLTLAFYVNFLLGLAYILSVFALMVPLAKDFLWGSVLAFLGSVLLATLFTGFAGFWITVPYLAFFGLHPIANYLQKKYVTKTPIKVVCLLAKTAWFDGVCLLSYFVLTKLAGIVFPAFISEYVYLVIFLAGTVLFIVYDVMIFLCQRSINRIVKRIGR